MAPRNLHRNLSILLLFISSLIYGQGTPTPVPFSSLPLSTSIDSVNDRIIYLHWNGVKWTNTIISPNYFFRIAKAAAGGGVNSANYLTTSNGATLINSWFHQVNRDSMMIKNGTRNCGIGQDGARSITSNMWFPNLGVFYDRGGHPVAIFNQNQSVVFDSSGNMKADFGNGLLKDINGVSQFSWSIYGVSIYTSPTAGVGDSILCYQAGTGLITKLARGSIVTGTGTTNYLPIFTGTNSLRNSTITLSGHLYNFNDAIQATQGNFGNPSATQGYMYLYNSTNNNSIEFASNAPAYNYGYVFPNYQGQIGQVLVDSAITGNLVYYKWGTASSTNYLGDTIGGAGSKAVLATLSYLVNTYAGSTHITTLGTIGTGTWNATIISPTYGGTGVNNGSNTLTWASSLNFHTSTKGYAYNHGNGIIDYDTTRIAAGVNYLNDTLKGSGATPVLLTKYQMPVGFDTIGTDSARWVVKRYGAIDTVYNDSGNVKTVYFSNIPNGATISIWYTKGTSHNTSLTFPTGSHVMVSTSAVGSVSGTINKLLFNSARLTQYTITVVKSSASYKIYCNQDK